MGDAQVELTRRYLLVILDAARTRDRERTEDASTYTAEEIVQLQLHKMGLPMLLSNVRAQLYYLYDKNCVKFHKTKVGREEYFTWRITADGVDVLEGNRVVQGIAGA